MKESLQALIDSLKERLKNIAQEQQESELFIRLKEKYDSLSTLGQRLVKALALIFTLFIILWLPLSNLMDASDINSNFELFDISGRKIMTSKLNNSVNRIQFNKPGADIYIYRLTNSKGKVFAAGKLIRK